MSVFGTVTPGDLSSTSSSSACLVRRAPSESRSENSESSSSGLLLARGGCRHVIKVPIQQHALLQHHSADFMATSEQDSSVSNLSSDTQTALLVMDFLRYLLDTSKSSDVVGSVKEAFEEDFLHSKDITSLAASIVGAPREREQFLKTYFVASERCGQTFEQPQAALWSAVEQHSAKITLLFGGQGSTNSVCLKELSQLLFVYEPIIRDFLEAMSRHLKELSLTPQTHNYYRGRRLDVMKWLRNGQTAPAQAVLETAAFSLPLVGLIGLVEYMILCRLIGKTPGEVRSSLAGATGHSQGIVVAAVVGTSESWVSFFEKSKLGLEILFWIGYYAHTNAPNSSVSPQMVQDSLDHQEGRPSSLLSIRGLQRSAIDDLIRQVNIDLPKDQYVQVALTNSFDSFVVAGPTRSLRGVSLHLRRMKASNDENDSRVPFHKRKPRIGHQFLPVSTPFHTPYLQSAAEACKSALGSKSLPRKTLSIPLLHTEDGSDLRECTNDDIVGPLVDAITQRFAHWPATLAAAMDTTHFIAFGPGRIGDLVASIKQGSEVRVINGSDFEVASGKEVGSREDMLSPSVSSRILHPISWEQRFHPKLTRVAQSSTLAFETRLSRLLGVPPVIVAGMTPTTVHWDVVSAIMNAGYHAELASGGYLNPEDMSRAINNLAGSIPKGRGITINLIYSSPKSIAWQIPMLKKLKSQGIPLDGLTIGAGVPSADVSGEYITGLGLKHISFKPGSTSAIREVLIIADAHPSFPIILQWTGGQGGGHHSYEDFHIPILDTYGEIRQRSNIILVAGSGFGDDKSSYPYLTGDWSTSYARPAMPFDGILLGSRLMVAREAHTSPEVKSLICKTPGVDASQWHFSYDGPVGGVMTVKSEMGQPIHKLATRGVRFWAQMDKVFQLPSDKKAAEIERRRDWIIERLNADFAKPWFGIDPVGRPCDVCEMTYAAVLERLIQLTYVRHQRRWIHHSYAQLTLDFANRALERLGGRSEGVTNKIWEMPVTFLTSFSECCPASTHQRLYPEDVAFFTSRCQARGQKPVNFIPVLDANLEHWMKKDSLWQSEDIDAVYDQDPERICILQGPVAVQYSATSNESVKQILDKICSGHVKMLQQDHECRQSDVVSLDEQSALIRSAHAGQSNSPMPSNISPAQVQPLVANQEWARALLEDESILLESGRAANIFKKMLSQYDCALFSNDLNNGLTISTRNEQGEFQEVVYATRVNSAHISVCFRYAIEDRGSSTLQFDYLFDASRVDCRLQDVTEHRTSRIQQFYSFCWLDRRTSPSSSEASHFVGPEYKVTSAILEQMRSAVQLAESKSMPYARDLNIVPLDFLTLIAWDSLAQALVSVNYSGDLLSLVHLKNQAEYICHDSIINAGDVLSSNARIQAISIEEPGKRVVVRANIRRGDVSIAVITSTFLIKGHFGDFHSTFEATEEPEMEVRVESSQDEALLRAREWFVLDEPERSLIGKTLIFRLKTHSTSKNRKILSQLNVDGDILVKSEKSSQPDSIGQVSYVAGECFGNPVTDYLERHGSRTRLRQALDHPGWDGEYEHEVRMPPGNELYSLVSQDHNPIHISPAFAALAGLEDCITHGMYTSAIVRHIVENETCGEDRKRFRSFSTHFVGAVVPNDVLTIRLRHIAMIDGQMVIEVIAAKKASGEEILKGEAIIEQPPTLYVFTGQGSQSKGMGMSLYESSPVAKAIWDDVDQFFVETYGWSIIRLVQTNPAHLTINFQGAKGRRIRQQYLDFKIERTQPDGSTVPEPAIPELTPSSTSYTFREPRGLLFATQFAQPAITLVAKATFEDLRAKGLVQEDAKFAGHSLGEYGALACLTDFVDFKTLMSVVFYRGLTMQTAMERDEEGRTDFGMVAVNPTRVGKRFDERTLEAILSAVSKESNALLEIVNFNVPGEQYVCAGTIRNIHTLTQVLDHLNTLSPATLNSYVESLSNGTPAMEITKLAEMIRHTVKASLELSKPVELQRGRATIPLAGIDVPFHSTHLRSAIPAYKRYLAERVKVEDLDPEKFVGRWVPNLVGKRFGLGEDFVRDVEEVTGRALSVNA